MKKGQGFKRGTGKMTPEEIGTGTEAIPDVEKQMADQYKGRTEKIWNPTRGVMEIRDIPKDDYKTKKPLKNDRRGDIGIVVCDDERARKSFESD